MYATGTIYSGGWRVEESTENYASKSDHVFMTNIVQECCDQSYERSIIVNYNFLVVL